MTTRASASIDCGSIHEACECHVGEDCGRRRNGQLSASCMKAGSDVPGFAETLMAADFYSDAEVDELCASLERRSVSATKLMAHNSTANRRSATR